MYKNVVCICTDENRSLPEPKEMSCTSESLKFLSYKRESFRTQCPYNFAKDNYYLFLLPTMAYFEVGSMVKNSHTSLTAVISHKGLAPGVAIAPPYDVRHAMANLYYNLVDVCN